MAAAQSALAALTAQTTAAGLGAPYYVDACDDAANARRYGFQALTSYGPCTGVGGGHQPWNALTARDARINNQQLPGGLQHVLVLTATQDGRPRGCVAGYYDAWHDLPTYGQWEDTVRGAYDALAKEPTRAPGGAVIYAWNELDEGGPGIVPTRQLGDTYLAAIKAVTSGAYPSTYENTVDDANLAISYTGPWTYDGPANAPCRVREHTLGADGDPHWAFIGNDETTTATPGAVASLTADGAARLQLIGARGPNRGQVDVSVDGGPLTSVDLYGAVLAPQQILFDSGPLPVATHTISVTVRLTAIPHRGALWWGSMRSGSSPAGRAAGPGPRGALGGGGTGTPPARRPELGSGPRGHELSGVPHRVPPHGGRSHAGHEPRRPAPGRGTRARHSGPARDLLRRHWRGERRRDLPLYYPGGRWGAGERLLGHRQRHPDA